MPINVRPTINTVLTVDEENNGNQNARQYSVSYVINIPLLIYKNLVICSNYAEHN